MNDQQHSTYEAYLHELADRLLLRDWEISLSRQWADNDAYAQVVPYDREDHLTIRIAEGFDGHSPEERREWLLHELLHAHLARVDRTIDRLGELRPDDMAVQLTVKAHKDESEIVVQRLARILASVMPLPPGCSRR